MTQALKRKEMITMNNREKDFRLIAPDIDSLLRFFRNGLTNATSPTPAVIAAIDPVFDALRNLATSKRNDEYKSIWLQIPRGTIDDYYSYEDMLQTGQSNPENNMRLSGRRSTHRTHIVA